ncbi:unnamed protein product [Allacma fusca]|uniref:Uncharacterized protein n=1 Tax=Allacma fusca TaxID=39272 RepID=A0A8J2K538_9HEXA|nr:unnamed protein product [Allacma fusca]
MEPTRKYPRIETSRNPVQQEQSTDSNVSENKFASLNTLSQILDAAKWISVISEGPEYLELNCDVCFTSSEAKGGVFKIKTGRENLETSTQCREFRNFKNSVNRHAQTANHMARLADALKVKRQLDAEEERAGLILGTVAYGTMKTYKSLNSYENQITCLADYGVYVGDINHSRRFPESMRALFYKVLFVRTKEVLQTPLSVTLVASPFTIWVDKITPNGTSFQIIGISTCVRGTNCCILLDICELGVDLTGNALAKGILDTIYKFYNPDEAKRLYLGAAVDGQYVILHVPAKILSLLGFNTGLDQTILPPFHHFWWDSAHVIELANSDMQRRFPWITEIDNIIKDVNSNYKYGQGHAELHQEAHRRTMKAASIESSSDTRFAAHEYEVLRNFHKTFQFIYAIMNQKNDPNLAKIGNMRFAILFSALSDFYKVISAASCQVQNSTSFPWDCDNAVTTMVQNLRCIAQSLNSADYNCDNDLLPYTNKCAKELLLHQTFQDSVLFRNRVNFHNLRSNANDLHQNVFEVIRTNFTKVADFFQSYCARDVVHLLLPALVRNKSECIAETVGSLIKGHLRGRGSLSNEAMSQELFLDFYGPPPHRHCHWLVKKALQLRFASSSIHFKRKSPSPKLSTYETSRVTDRCHLETGRIPPPEA